MPKRAAWSRSIVSVSVSPPVCWSVATSASCGSVFSLLKDLRRPSFSSSRFGVLQRVLVQRPGRPAADVDVLRGLQEQRGALDLRELRPQPADDLHRAIALRSSRGLSVINIRPLFCV